VREFLEKQFRVALFPKRVRWRELEFDGSCASFIRDSSAADRLLFTAVATFVTELPIAGSL
jgi:hypothetical protein